MSKISFKDLLKEALLMEVSIENLQKQFVDTGDISQETFDQIVTVSGGKSAYATWLVKRVDDEVIKEEDIYKFEDYLKIFEKSKNLYPEKDINQIKTPRQVDAFIRKSVELKDMGAETQEVESGKSLLSPTQVKSLDEVGIKLLGVVAGFQCFKVPSSLKGNKEAYKRYKNLLGQCSAGGIEICTIANQSYFDSYLGKDDLYVFFNLSEPRSPIQFHYGDNQFMDRQDRSIFTELED